MNYQFAIKEPLSLRIFSPVQTTGFKYHELEEGTVFSTETQYYNHILFLLEGEIRISCNEFINQRVHEREFAFIPIAADVKCKALTPVRVLLFTFDNFMNQLEKEYALQLQQICAGTEYTFTTLPFNIPIDNFIEHLLLYIKQKLNKKILLDIKQMELLVILKTFFKPEEIAAFFHPVIGKSYGFRIQVMRSYRNESNVEGMAERVGLEKRSFSRQFKEEFDVSPYQWLLNQKAKHIRFSLAESDKSLDEIRKEFGFKFAGHFTRFCKEQFLCTPVKLRRQLAYEE